MVLLFANKEPGDLHQLLSVMQLGVLPCEFHQALSFGIFPTLKCGDGILNALVFLRRQTVLGFPGNTVVAMLIRFKIGQPVAKIW